jgi:hypothetical protein
MVLAASLAAAGVPALAGDRLAWTGAVTQIEGAAGGGLVPWALIGGLGTDDQFGASGFATYVSTGDFNLRTAGLSGDFDDRMEFSWARQRFDAGSVIPGLTLGQDVVGVKVRVVGDAIFDPDKWLPQVALGAQWKHTLNFDEAPRALGAAAGQDVDLYVALTKLYFAAIADRNILLDLTVRRTRANQFGLLGFGGDQGAYRWEPEASAAIFLTDALLLGAEYRSKPDNLQAVREDSAKDIFLAWGPSKNASLVLSWVDLGRIATKSTQRGLYASLWLGI